MIGRHSVVSFHYVMKDEAGEALDDTHNSKPMVYVHGTDSMLSGLEAALEGRKSGDCFQVTITPEQGFGEINPDLCQVLSKKIFEGMELEVGMVLNSQSDSFEMRTITAIEGDMITLDANHPMAGKTLHFDIEILFVRSATSDEIRYGIK